MARLNTRKTEQESSWEVSEAFILTDREYTHRKIIRVKMIEPGDNRNYKIKTARQYCEEFRQTHGIKPINCYINLYTGDFNLPRAAIGIITAATQIASLFDRIKFYDDFSDILIKAYCKYGADDQIIRYYYKGAKMYYQIRNKNATEYEIWKLAIMSFLQIYHRSHYSGINETKTNLNYTIIPLSYSQEQGFQWRIVYSQDIDDWNDHIFLIKNNIELMFCRTIDKKREESELELEEIKENVLKYFYSYNTSDTTGKWLTQESRRTVELFLQDWCDELKSKHFDYFFGDDSIIRENEDIIFIGTPVQIDFKITAIANFSEHLNTLPEDIKKRLTNKDGDGVGRELLKKFLNAKTIQQLCNDGILIKSSNNRGWILRES